MATPTPRQTARTSKEAQRNAKAELAYRTMRYLGAKSGDATQEQWGVPSTTSADVLYVVTHDLAHDGERYHCSCIAGQNARGCCHVQAARRKVADRRATANGYEMLYGDYTAW